MDVYLELASNAATALPHGLDVGFVFFMFVFFWLQYCGASPTNEEVAKLLFGRRLKSASS